MRYEGVGITATGGKREKLFLNIKISFMTKYVVGFMFNENETDVLLIEKNKPKWQEGKFNGIGGKIEKYKKQVPSLNSITDDLNYDWETPLRAMIREFKEETGITYHNWKYIITMFGEDWSVDVFTATTDKVFNFKTMEDEQVHLIPIADLDKYDLISNLYWLIPMCLDKNDDHKSGINYSLSNNRLAACTQPV